MALILKMRIRSLLILCYISYSNSIVSQTAADNWYFGDLAGLKFEGDSIEIDTHSILSSSQGGATWSNSSGELQFYANQQALSNRNHELMPNGFFAYSSSAIQSPVICPNTNDTNEFLLFSLENNFNCSLYYSVISMDLDSGLGDIDTNRKRIFLRDSLSRRMTSYPKCDGSGHWLLTRDAYNSNLYSYSISNGILDNIPQIYSGVVTPGNFAARTGEMNFSPNGKRLALCHWWENKIEFFDFNIQTGQLSNPFSINIGSPPLNPYGLEFSPNGDRLYVSCSNTLIGQPEAILLQLNLELYDSISVSNSIDTISAGSFHVYSQQTGPDGLIYIAANDTFLHCILEPNELGAACNFQLNYLDLDGRYSRLGLPQFDQGSLINPVKDRVYCLGDSAFFEYNDSCLVSLLWNFGDSNSGNNTSTSNSVFHVFSDAGVYNTTLEVNYSAGTKSYANTITVLPNQIMDEFNDTIYLCDSTLCVNQTLVNYEWSTGETSRCIAVSEEGLYVVTLSNACDTLVESLVVITSQVYTGGIQSQQQNGSVVLTAFPGTNYQWNTGDTSQSITVTTPGTYSVAYFDEHGCEYEASINLDEDDFVGILGLSNNQAFDIYPNPTSDIVNIVSNRQGIFEVAIRDVTGKVVQRENIEFVGPQQIELIGIKNGVYFVSIENDESGAVEMVVVSGK